MGLVLVGQALAPAAHATVIPDPVGGRTQTLTLTGAPVYSSTAPATDFTYTTDGGTVTITGYTGPGGEVVIPDIIAGLPVATIGAWAFNSNTSLTIVTIPNSVTSIGGAAFGYCYGLTSATIPNSVTSIGEYAFFSCEELTSVTIGNGVTSIGEYAFASCIGLTSLAIPNGVASIGEGAFAVCVSLTSVYFEGHAPGTVGLFVFDGADNATVYYQPGTTGWGATFAGRPTAPLPLPFTYTTDAGEVTITGYTGPGGAVVIPDTIAGLPVTAIGDFAFEENTSLISVTIGNGVISIGLGAFRSCTGLTSVAIPNSVTSIGENAFHGCTGLTSITVDAGNPNYSSADGVLFNKALTTVIRCPEGKVGGYTIPNNVTSIGSFSFDSCAGLTSVTIPNSVTSIGSYAFTYCTGLTSVTIPDSVTSIGSYAFDFCTRLTSVTIPNSVTSIGDAAFRSCTGLTSATIPNSVTSIGDAAFRSCTGLTSVTIPSSVTSIGSYAFADCTGLTSVTIPNSVTSIAGYAFASCTGLTSVSFGGNAPGTVGSNIFLNANNVTVYYLPGTTGWGATFAGRPTASLPLPFTYTTDAGGVTITGYTGPGGAVVIPDTIAGQPVTGIGDAVFHYNASLTSVTIPNSVTSIGMDAFSECTGLTSVTLPNSLASIGNFAFYHCTGLTSVTFPNSLARIGNNAFVFCTGLTSVTLPNSLASIGNFAFRRCAGLTSVTIPISVTSIGINAFSSCDTLTTIAVDAGNPSYTSADGVLFNKALTLLVQCPGGKAGGYAIPNSVTSIGSSAFDSCTGLTSLTIPSSVTSIGSSAFYSCTGLTSVTIPSSVTSIGSSAFHSCTGLTSVTIPSSVTSIGSSAFRSCKGLTSVTIGNGVTSIGYSAFESCTGLNSVYFEGDTPASVDEDVFYDAANVTVYHLPGTTGWGATFQGRPTVLWNPQFGAGAAPFGFSITATSDLVIVVEAATDLMNPVWMPVSTNTLTTGSSTFTDPDAANFPVRYYRFRAP